MTVENETNSEESAEVEALEPSETDIETPAAANETPEQTARAVMEGLKAKADAEEAEEGDKPSEITEAARKLASARKPKRRQTFVPVEEAQSTGEPAPQEAAPAAAPQRVEAPASWDVKDKEWFLAQPPEVQRNAVKWFKEAQGHTTKLWQELNREADRIKDIDRVVASHWKELGLEGKVSKAQAINELFNYQRRINADDVGAILEMMQHRRISLQALQARMTGQTQAPAQPVQQQPQTNFLTADQVRQIWREEQLQSEQHRATQSATAEVVALKQEVQNGRYLWPELHDPATVQRIQPLVSYFGETNPGLSWAQRYKRAVTQDRINRGAASPSPASPRLTPDSIQSVKQASSSLRSRGGNGVIPTIAEPKANETARESAEAAYYQIFGNKQH